MIPGSQFERFIAVDSYIEGKRWHTSIDDEWLRAQWRCWDKLIVHPAHFDMWNEEYWLPVLA